MNESFIAGRTNLYMYDNTTMCGKKNNALSLVRKKCNNKKQCIVRASNRIYKDLCKGRSDAYNTRNKIGLLLTGKHYSTLKEQLDVN
jgi:hypothetical protein